jgi:hypothetical protein
MSPPEKIKSNYYAVCLCNCGAKKPVRIDKLLNGTSQSCGCLQRDNLTTHGMTATAVRKDSHEYWIWNMVVQRCTNNRVKNWMDYGGRGITVCEEWLKYENFIADMGVRPSIKHSLERRDNEAGYSKSNCYWATRMEQAKNKRNNRWIEINGETKHLAGWARHFGTSQSLAISRVGRGWTWEDALSKPPRKITTRKRIAFADTIPLLVFQES